MLLIPCCCGLLFVFPAMVLEKAFRLRVHLKMCAGWRSGLQFLLIMVDQILCRCESAYLTQYIILNGRIHPNLPIPIWLLVFSSVTYHLTAACSTSGSHFFEVDDWCIQGCSVPGHPDAPSPSHFLYSQAYREENSHHELGSFWSSSCLQGLELQSCLLVTIKQQKVLLS